MRTGLRQPNMYEDWRGWDLSRDQTNEPHASFDGLKGMGRPRGPLLFRCRVGGDATCELVVRTDLHGLA